MEPVHIGLLGLGTVGDGTRRVLERNRQEISRRAGREILIRQVAVRNLDRPDAANLTLSTDPEAVVDDPSVAVVVELIGGIEPARSLVLRAIEQGKHIVTANKALIALHGNEIFAAAHQHGVMVAFEAAVAGGIPIIKTLREGLTGNRIQWVAGIINGTCNYILSRMREEGVAFPEVLADAQRLGYAETDPSFDVDGIDAAHKLTILASIAFGIPLQYDRVHTEGIAQLHTRDIQYAAELGYAIKHLGIARRSSKGIELRVHPTLIPERHVLASVSGVMNAVLIQGDAVGSTLSCGAGAGAEPTASAVVADLVDVVRTLTVDPHNRVPHLAFQPDALSDVPVLDVTAMETAYYLRLQAEDRPGVLAEVTRILAESEVSIEAMLQKARPADSAYAPVIIVTHRISEGQMNQAIERIESLPTIGDRVVRLRLEHLAD